MKRHAWLPSMLSLACLVLLAAPAGAQTQAKMAPHPSAANPGCTGQPSVPPPPSEAIQNALRLYRAHKFDAAIQSYKTIIATNTDLGDGYAGLARVYLREKDLDAAFNAATLGIKADPTSPDANAAMGEVYFRAGELHKAEEAFLAPVRACWPNARAYYGLARIYEATSNFRRARAAIDEAHSLDPSDPEIGRAWMETLPRDERIKYLKAHLAIETNGDGEERSRLQRSLALLENETPEQHNSCRLVSNVIPAESNLDELLSDPYHRRGYALRVELNGAPARLLVDTGSSGILIDRRIAEKAHVTPVTAHEVHGIGDSGAQSGYIGYADSLQVGALEFRGCYVDVVDSKSVADSDGLIGADVFSDFLVELDFPDAKFKLSPLPPGPPPSPREPTALDSSAAGDTNLRDRYIAPEMDSYIRAYRFGHALLIPTRLNNRVTKLFLIDTGAFDDTISPRAAKEVTKISRDGQTRVHGMSGAVKDVYRADRVTLQFGHFEQKRWDLVTFDLTRMSDGFGTEISGTLGFAMLQLLDIRIDYRDGLVDFRYDENRLH
ncbi:MAG TPA: aspartyl protease family protein [Candidatus Limnocylindrales bacterium]|nr:aspartyl protease family protein [Candidatus Limnocylindrales bacterium]